MDENGKPNAVLENILKNSYDSTAISANGMPAGNAILSLFDAENGYKGVNTQGTFSDIVAPSTNRALYQTDVNNDREHTQTIRMTRDQYLEKFQAFVDANPAISRLLEAGKITERDVADHFFKDIEFIDKPKNQYPYKYYPRTYYSRGGGGGGYSGYRSGGGGSNNSYSQAYNQNPLTVSRVFNVMKNWEF